MAEAHRKNWRDLCSAALEAKDPDELLKIVQELNRVLKREEQVRRDFREALKSQQSSRGDSMLTTGSIPHRVTRISKHAGAETNECHNSALR
jgi:hypothetical protein